MKDETKNKKNSPYLLGLLCILPLIGGFVGLGLLLLGIFKYKDKWLAIIGASGIIFTILVYFSLFYYMKNGDLSKKGFADLSQQQLNELVKTIEYYKLNNGVYPDSLQQLQKTNKYLIIVDAIQAVQKRSNVNYNYQKLENKYILFSSGQDGIPYTKDDLFPQVSIKELNKIGLIKPQLK